MEKVTGQPLKSEAVEELCRPEEEVEGNAAPKGEPKIAGQGSSLSETLNGSHRPRS
jgi:hypothetical protein